MLPSSTVENYLKTIHQHELTLQHAEALVPMGALAARMGVTPGTATSMVKALAEAHLVRYEPYAGVRLLPSGARLARRVIRRHRLVELFLVKVMGFRWDEVHDDAELLEHAVSERLIERMDEMLGRPEADPHGDPIPTPEGDIPERELHSLLTCPVGAPLRVMRVTDQDAGFLRFLEQHHLKPGEPVTVDERDEAADSVRLRPSAREALTIGARAASKVLVELIVAVVMLVIAAHGAIAQTTTTPPPRGTPSEPFAITDNSFFIEEAFNQEPGVFQNIVGLLHDDGSRWAMGFTQEWPAPSMRHQLSYTLTLASVTGGGRGPGDALINYRYQLLEEGPGRPAMSPRVSVILPTGNEAQGLSTGGWGWQFNVPMSKQVGDFYVHANAGLTWFPSLETVHAVGSNSGSGAGVSIESPFAGGSAIYRLRPMFHLMLESLVTWQDDALRVSGTARQRIAVVSPGVRGGWNVGDAQVVLGAAIPISRVEGDTSVGVFGYFSYELHFKH
jgi:DtxR family Mn-dependent transcriptional regulator